MTRDGQEMLRPADALKREVRDTWPARREAELLALSQRTAEPIARARR